MVVDVDGNCKHLPLLLIGDRQLPGATPGFISRLPEGLGGVVRQTVHHGIIGRDLEPTFSENVLHQIHFHGLGRGGEGRGGEAAHLAITVNYF